MNVLRAIAPGSPHDDVSLVRVPLQHRTRTHALIAASAHEVGATILTETAMISEASRASSTSDTSNRGPTRRRRRLPCVALIDSTTFTADYAKDVEINRLLDVLGGEFEKAP